MEPLVSIQFGSGRAGGVGLGGERSNPGLHHTNQHKRNKVAVIKLIEETQRDHIEFTDKYAML